MPGITIVCIWSPFRAGIHNRSVAIAPDLTACQPFSLMTVPLQSRLHVPTAHRRSEWCSLLPLKALSASGTDNRV